MNMQKSPEAMPSDSYYTYQCEFTGRKKDAEGETYGIRTFVMAGTPEGAKLKLYDTFEHIGGLIITPAQPEACRIMLTALNVFKLWNNRLPNFGDFDYSDNSTELRFSLWREGTISNLYMQLSPQLSLSHGYNFRKKNTFNIRFSSSYRSRNNGYRQAGDSIEINVSADKTAEQVVKDIKKRIFEKHADEIAKINAKLLDYQESDKLTDKHREALNLGPTENKKYLGDTVLDLSPGYISVNLRQQYFSAKTPEKALKIVNLLNKALETIRALED